MTDPDVSHLIDRSIDDLENLAVRFANDIEQARSGGLGTRQRFQKEALLTINILLPKLRVARGIDPSSGKGSDA